MAPKRSCCIRFCCCCPRSSSFAIETHSVAPNNSEARGSEIEPAVEANLCNVSGPAHQSNKAPVSASQNILQKSDQNENVNVNKNVSGDPGYNETDPPTASSEASKYDMPAKASTSVPSNAVPTPSQSDKGPVSASPNILQKSDQDENVNVNKNVSGYNETDPPTASNEASKYDMRAESSTSVSSNVVPMKYEVHEHHVDANLKAPAPSQSFNVPQKSEGANVNINQNVSGAPRCSTGSTPSSSSPTQPTKSGLFKAIQDQDKGKGVDVNLDELMDHISKLLKLREEEMLPDKKASTTSKFSWPERFKNLNEILSWGTDLKNLTGLLSSGLDFASKLKEVISGPVKELLKDIGQASIATAGLLVVAYVLERCDELSSNNKNCWDLIKEMSRLASVVKRWDESSKGTVDVREDATALVVEGAIMCCSQLGSSACKSFFLSSKGKADLSGITQKLNREYLKIIADIGISNSTDIERALDTIANAVAAIESKRNPPVSRKYPEHAVGIDKSIEEVVSLLEIESEQNAVTVILHGFGGMGKTTLADAVVSKDTVVSGFKYSKVRLRKDSVIENLQKEILENLMEPGDPIPKIMTYEDGRRELLERLKTVQAFIYIDDVLKEDALRKLLPLEMSTAKKVRLLLTARDENVKIACPRPCTEPKIYKMEGIQHQEALIILQREIKNGINESQFKGIIDTCAGIPLMLTLAAPFIGRAKNKEKAYSTLVLQKNKWPREDFKKMWKRYAFAYDALAPYECQEPFLDICSYFKGWDWETVEDIVGKDELEMLESRALVTRTTNNVASVHDVILTLAAQKSKEESKGKEVRLAFNSASKLEEFLQEEGAEGIKGIWLSDNKDLLEISATTLDLMSKSLRVLQLGKLANVKGKCTETFKELVFFEAKVEQLPFQDVSKLKQLRYLSYEPNDLKLSKMPSSLRHMELDGRSHGHAFQIPSNAFQQLEHLRILRLVNFSKLKNLPEKLGDRVKGLHELSLSACRSITKLPDSISNLQSLQILKMDHCSNLTELPDDFGSLSSLRELHLDWCSDLKALPDSAEKLSSLTLLNLFHCSRLSNLPPCVGKLAGLVELNLSNCFKLESIPKGIGELNELRTLDVSFCHGLWKLADGFCNLSSITTLSFRNCSYLEKLPDPFVQLASLKVLDLSSTSLRKLPKRFGQLKNLEVLDLQRCEKLKELCNDFHGLSSLQNLDLRWCDRLEGKSMDHVVKMNRLQLIVRIEGSKELVQRWAELIERDGDAGSRSLRVISGQHFSISRVEKENIEKNLLSELDGLTNGRREKFHLSDLPANTLILAIGKFPLFIEEMIDEELQIKIFYIGPHFDKFSTKVKDNIFVVDVSITRTAEMFQKVLLTLDLARNEYEDGWYLQIDGRMVGDGQRDEYRPCWRLLTHRELEEFMLCNCKRYLRLKQPADEESNIGLLRELLAPQGDETTPVFQKNESSQQDPTANSEVKATCGVDKLKGKTILLEIRPPHSFDHDIRLPSLKEMYLRQKDRLNFEIISIPLVKPIAEKKRFDFHDIFHYFTGDVSDVFDVYKQFSREVPWLVLQNPWMTITRAVQYFLAKQCTTGWEEIKNCEIWYPTINWIIDPKGRITIYSPSISPRDRGEVFAEVLFNYLESESYQVRWGVNASLTTLGEIEEVRKKEWKQLKNMSTLEFLFNHLKSVQVKVKELMSQGKFICLYRGEYPSEITSSMEQFRDSIHFIHFSHEVSVLRLASIFSKDYYYPLKNTTRMEGTSLLKLSRHETVSFIMRLQHLEEEINGMDESDKQLCELKRVLHSLQHKPKKDNRHGSITFFDERGNSVAGLTGWNIEWRFLYKRKDRAERLIKTMMKDFERHDEDSLIKNMQTVSAAAVEQQNVDFDALRNYISELWEVQFYQSFKFNKEGKKRSPARVTWPTSRGFCPLKNLLSEGANDDWVKDVISRHSEEDACRTIIKSVLKDIEEEEWAVASLLAVAELLERMETVPNDDRIEWLLVVDEMFRLAQYCKQFNQKYELWRRMKCGAIAVILIYSIGCCCLIDPSKFEFSVRWKGWNWLWEAEEKLREECDTLGQTIESLYNESGSLAKLMCYRRGLELWPESEDEGGPSSVHESSASFPKAGSTGSTREEESEDELGPESENEGEDELGPESEDDGENEGEDELGPESEDEGGPSSVHESSASFPKAGSTGSTGEEE